MTPARRSKKRSRGAHVDELDALVAPERLDDLLALALAHQPGVDEHARELRTDGLVHERGGDGRVDAAGEAADDPFGADLVADRVDRRLDDRGHRPGRPAAARVVEEVLEHLLPVRRVHHLGVELHAVDASIAVLERGRGRVGRGRGDDEPVRGRA